MPERDRLLLAPAGGAGQGAGHLVRCAGLARELGGCDIHTGSLEGGARRLLQGMVRRGTRLVERLDRDTWRLVVLDRRSTTVEELRDYERHGTVVCLDEGGAAREAASYTIDALPRLPDGPPPNIASLGFLDLPAPSRARRRWPPRSVLVSFGAEDAADLAGAFLAAAAGPGGLLPDAAISVLDGPLSRPRGRPAGVRSFSLGARRRVRDLFDQYDLLVTHFGVTALEALAAGLPVVLLNPSPYHRQLARAAGIPEVGVGAVDVRRLRAILRSPARPPAAVERLRRAFGDAGAGSLAEHLRMLACARGTGCPSCGRRGAVIARFPLRTWRRCPDCRLEYVERFDGRRPAYGARYFFQDYRRQYGRTYLEDFPSIMKAGRERIAIMEQVLGWPTAAAERGAIVDIGCAYGPFLAALREAGWPCMGVDVSREAVRYVRSELGIPAVAAPFERLRRRDLPPGKLQAITMWFVIEHLDDLGGALAKLADLLPPGGLLAFSTPNGRGISWRRNRRAFLEASPADHRLVLSPPGLRGLLARHGFQLRRVRVTGHHPERFPGLLGSWGAKLPVARRLLAAASGLLGLGDTFEAYAVRRA